jgi:hypothetical protein
MSPFKTPSPLYVALQHRVRDVAVGPTSEQLADDIASPLGLSTSHRHTAVGGWLLERDRPSDFVERRRFAPRIDPNMVDETLTAFEMLDLHQNWMQLSRGVLLDIGVVGWWSAENMLAA